MDSDLGDLNSRASHRFYTSRAAKLTFTTILILITPALVRLLYSTLKLQAASRKLRSQARPPLPPGSSGLSIIGDLISFTSNHDAFLLARFAKYGPVFRSIFLGKSIFVEAPAGNKLIFANDSKLVQAFLPGFVAKLAGRYALSFRTGAAYKQLRRHLMPFLSPPALSQYLQRIERHVKDHLAEFWQPLEVDDKQREDFQDPSQGFQRPSEVKGCGHQGDEFQLSIFQSMSCVAFSVILDLVLSLRPNETDELRRLYSVWAKGLTLVPIDLPGTPYRRAFKARAAIYEILDKMIVTRREELKNGSDSTSQDLLSYLVSTPDETGALCGDEEIKDNILHFLFAGHDTSGVVMTMTLRMVALHPEVHQRLQEEHDAIADRKGPGYGLSKDDLAEMKYTWWVVQETMRVQAPVRFGFREVLEDFEFGGYTFLKGWKVWWNSLSHVDPRCFSDPEKFDPTRFNGEQTISPYAYAPFGGGARICPGYDFAKMEMLIILHYVLRSYTFSLVNPSEPIIRRVPFPKQKSGTLMRIGKRNLEAGK